VPLSAVTVALKLVGVAWTVLKQHQHNRDLIQTADARARTGTLCSVAR
jgi:hypothetical protein